MAPIDRLAAFAIESRKAGPEGVLFSAFASVHDVHNARLIPVDEFEATEGNFVRFITTPGGQEWWEQTKHMYPTRLVSAVEAASATRPLNPITESWRFLAPGEA